jgi:hypothetical protein
MYDERARSTPGIGHADSAGIANVVYLFCFVQERVWSPNSPKTSRNRELPGVVVIAGQEVIGARSGCAQCGGTVSCQRQAQQGPKRSDTR